MTTTAQGTAGDRVVKTILQGMGWGEVADLARAYPGADLLCIYRYPRSLALLWVEVKTYPWRKVEPDSRLHIKQCAEAHAPDPHLTVCLQNDLHHTGKRWRVVTVAGEPWPDGVPAPLLIGFKQAYPPHLAHPPYTTGRSAVPSTGSMPVGASPRAPEEE